MDIRCPSCSKLFRVADEKIDGKGIRFKCSKCAEVITITKDDFEMDLLAREGEAEVPAAPAPAAAIKTAPTPPPPAPQPEAREYKPHEYQPPVDHPADEGPAADQQIPPASLSDFDFSEPHAAATAAAHPAEGFGGAGSSFDGDTDLDAAPEIEISPEAAAEAEAALQFPDDLISEPKRKPAFGSTSPVERAPEAEAPEPDLGSELTMPEGLEGDGGPADAGQDLDLGAALAMPKGMGDEEGPAEADQDIDLGAALAMPKGSVGETGPNADDQGPDKNAAQASPKGPVLTPELLAQMKRNAPAKAASQTKAASSADEDMDLGAALAMPKTMGSNAGQNAASAQRGAEEPSSGRRTLVIGVVALALIAVLAALYYLGFLWGKSGQETQQKPQPTSQPRSQPARQMITPEGLTVAEPVAFIDPERKDLVITGKIQNNLDKPKAGWYLVIEVRDSKEAVLTTVTMVNGVQLFADKDRDLLAKRGTKVEDLRTALQKGAIPAQGSVNFEARVLNPPAESTGFLPTLRSIDPATLGESK